MKKFITAILALLFISTSTGMTFHLHYCMDKLAKVNLRHIEKEEDSCSKCGMAKDKKKGCCKDELRIIKTDDAQIKGESKIPSLEAFTFVLPPQPFLVKTTILSFRDNELPQNNEPPDRLAVPLYLSNCVFRI